MGRNKAVLVLDAETASFNTKMLASSKTTEIALRKINSAMTGIVLNIGAITTGIGIMTAVFSREAARIEHGITEIGTLMGGLADGEMTRMRKELQALSELSGKPIDDLINARYDIVSAGFDDIADSAHLTSVAMKTAVATASEVKENADLLTTAINAYNLSVQDAMPIADIFAATIDKGKIRMSELANIMGRAIPLAAELGIPVTELSAAIATLTKDGQGAQEAITGLRSIFVKMLKPTEKANQVLQSMGYNSFEALIQAQGLDGALASLREEGAKLGITMAQIVNRARGLTAALPLSGNSAEEFTEIFKFMEDAGGNVDEKFKQMSKTLTVTFQRAWRTVKGIMADIGFVIMPVIKDAFISLHEYLDKNGKRVVAEWGNALSSSLKLIVKNAEEIQKVFKVLITYGITAMAVNLVGNVVKLAKGLTLLGGAAATAAGPLGVILYILTALTSVTAIYQGKLGGLVSGIKDLGTAIVLSLKGLGLLIIQIAMGIGAGFDIIAKKISNFAIIMFNVFDQMVSGLGRRFDVLKLRFESLKKLGDLKFTESLELNNQANELEDSIGNFSDIIKAAVENAQGNLKETNPMFDKDFLAFIGDEAIDSLDKSGELYIELAKKFKDFWVGVFSGGDEKKPVEDKIKTLVDDINNAISGINLPTTTGGTANLFSEKDVKIVDYLEKMTDQISTNMAQAFVYGQRFGEAMVNSLKAIAAQLISKAGSFLLLSAISGGSGGLALAAGAKVGGGFFDYLLGGFQNGGIIGYPGGGLIKSGFPMNIPNSLDDTLIAAQRGEAVVRKNVVDAYGKSNMDSFSRTGDLSDLNGGIDSQTMTKFEKKIIGGDTFQVNFSPRITAFDSKDVARYTETTMRKSIIGVVDKAIKNREMKYLQRNRD